MKSMMAYQARKLLEAKHAKEVLKAQKAIRTSTAKKIFKIMRAKELLRAKAIKQLTAADIANVTQEKLAKIDEIVKYMKYCLICVQRELDSLNNAVADIS